MYGVHRHATLQPYPQVLPFAVLIRYALGMRARRPASKARAFRPYGVLVIVRLTSAPSHALWLVPLSIISS